MIEPDRQEIRKKNLAAFKDGGPALFEQLINHKRLSDRTRCGEFEALVREEFPAVVEALRRDALAIIDDPADVPKPLTSKVWENPIEEKLHSWGKVSRNAPCPCNSGKRYKHCHGKN